MDKDYHNGCKQERGDTTHRSIMILSTSLVLLLAPLQLSAAPLTPHKGKLVTRCADSAKNSLSEESGDENCMSPWAEELQNEYQGQDPARWWERFSVGPQELNEHELQFQYRPGERRPLWGY